MSHSTLSSKRTPTFSVCMIARNEAHCIERCLGSLQGLDAEVIIVDTGSVDGTPRVARSLGAQVIDSPWERDFSKARNIGIDHARGRWILVIDSDEYLLARDRDLIRDLAAIHSRDKSPAVAFELLQASTLANSPGRMLVSIVRLFPRHPAVRYEWPVHEQVVIPLSRQGIKILPTKIELQHTGYANPDANREKQLRNLEILKGQLSDKSKTSPHVAFLAAGSYLDLGHYSEALATYREVSNFTNAPADLVNGSKVRIVTCLLKLQQPALALSEFPPRFDSSWHPELVRHRADVEKAMGRAVDALTWYRRVLRCPDAAYIPPCNVSSLKLGALTSIAQLWKEEGNMPLALAVLKKAKELLASGTEPSEQALSAVYAQFGVADEASA